MILQSTLPLTPWADAPFTRLPGMTPIDMDQVVKVDEAYSAQMAYRDALLADQREAVFHKGAPEASAELLRELLEILPKGFEITPRGVTRPDGVFVEMGEPLLTAARLVQEDLVILEKQDGEHALKAAALCFPASWSLDEKAGHGLKRIHAPVEEYDSDITRRVQRLFDGLKVGQPLMRANWLLYEEADLFQPRRENAARDKRGPELPFVRVERQSLVRLPTTQAVVFFIHTYVVKRECLSAEQEQSLAAKLYEGRD